MTGCTDVAKERLRCDKGEHAASLAPRPSAVDPNETLSLSEVACNIPFSLRAGASLGGEEAFQSGTKYAREV